MLGTYSGDIFRLLHLKSILSPISDDIGLSTTWWTRVEKVFAKLLDTKKGNPDTDWWSRVIRTQSFGSGGDRYDGWYIREFLGKDRAISLGKMTRGFNVVPLTIKKQDETVRYNAHMHSCLQSRIFV